MPSFVPEGHRTTAWSSWGPIGAGPARRLALTRAGEHRGAVVWGGSPRVERVLSARVGAVDDVVLVHADEDADLEVVVLARDPEGRPLTLALGLADSELRELPSVAARAAGAPSAAGVYARLGQAVPPGVAARSSPCVLDDPDQCGHPLGAEAGPVP